MGQDLLEKIINKYTPFDLDPNAITNLFWSTEQNQRDKLLTDENLFFDKYQKFM